LSHLTQAIDNVVQSNTYPVNRSRIAIHHGSKKLFGPLQPAAFSGHSKSLQPQAP
jgi:hypothetical protein